MADFSQIAQLASPTARRLVVDSTIEQNRAAASPETLAQREQPRLSIAEMNALDLEQIQLRFSRSKADTRTSFVKFLDLIDLPRNSVANALASFTAPQLRQTEDRATAGMPRVMFSDFLREMGVENRVVRGVVGFVGDVAMDPLTYLGGAGIGLRVAGKSGQAINVGLAGRRQLRRGIKATAKGGQASNATVRELIEAAAGGPGRLEVAQRLGFKPDDIQTMLSNRILGSPTTGNRLRSLITAPDTSRGILSEAVDKATAASAKEAAQLAAAKKFLTEFGVGTRGIGPRGGTTVARIPFTDAAVRIPAITSRAIQQRAGLAVAAAGVVPEAAFGGDLLRHASDVRVAVDQAEKLTDRIIKIEDSIEASRLVGGITDARQAELARSREALNELVASAKASTEASSQALNRLSVNEIADANPGQIAALAQQMRAQQAMVDRVAQLRDRQFSRTLDTLRKELVSTRDNVIGDRLAALDEEAIAGTIDHATYRERSLALLNEFDASLRDTSARIINMSDINAEASMLTANVVSDYFTTNINLADAMQASVMGFLKQSDRRLVEVAKQQLMMGDAALGAAVFTPMNVMVQSTIGDTEFGAGVIKGLAKAEQTRRRTFGVHDGLVAQITGHMRYSARRGRDRVADAAARSVGEMRSEVLRRYGLNPHGQDGIDANDLLHIMLYIEREKQLASFGQRGGVHRFIINTPDDIKKLASEPGGEFNPRVVSYYTPMYQRMIEIRSRSFGQPGMIQNVMRDMEPVAKYVIALLDEAGDVAVSERMLSSLLPGYVPRTLTPLAEQSIAQQRTLTSFKQGQPRGAEGLTQVREGFTKPRSTTIYRFRPPEKIAQKHGLDPLKEYEFFEFERQWLNHKDQLDFIRTHYETTATEIAKQMAAVRAFDDYARSLGIDRARQAELLGTQADTFRLNDEFAKERFAPLATKNEIGDFLFDTDVPRVIGDRIAQQYAMQSRQKLRELVPHMTLSAPVDALASARVGEIVFTNGVRGRVVSGRGERQVVRIGDQLWRQLDRQVVGGSDPVLVEGLRGPGFNAFWPVEAADAIENTARVLQPQNVNELIQTADALHNAWKATTLFHPSWIVANLIGGTIQALQGSLAVGGSITKHAKDLVKIALNLNNRAWLESNYIDIAGRGRVLVADIVDDAIQGRVVGSSRTDNVFMEMVNDGRYRPLTASGETLRERVASAASQAARSVSDDFVMSAQAYARAVGRTNRSWYDNVRATRNVVVSERMLRRVLGPWFSFNGRVEDSLRLGAYIGHLESGMSSADAAAMVRKTLFDYDDLTTAERQVMRRVFPFYTWIRFSGAFQAKQALENPAIFALAPKLKESIEEALVGDAAIPEHMRPMWMREALAIQLLEEPGKQFGVLGGSLLPTETAMRFGAGLTQGGAGLQDLLQYFTTSINPVISTPLQIGAGTEFFTGRTIGNPGQADLGRMEFALGQIRPARELGIGSSRQGPLARAAEAGPDALATRLILGGRGQSMDPERLNYHRVREFEDIITGIRRSINVAERNGRDSTELRARLMSIYQRMVDVGLEEEVPKWALAQLQELSVR